MNACSEIPLYPFPKEMDCEMACDYVKAHYSKCGDDDIEISINSVGYLSSLGRSRNEYFGYSISYFWQKGDRSGIQSLDVKDLESVERFVRDYKIKNILKND